MGEKNEMKTKIKFTKSLIRNYLMFNVMTSSFHAANS